MVQINSATATFDNFLRPIVHLENDWLSINDFIYFYAQVSPKEEIRDAAREATQILSTKKLEQPDISKWVKAIYDRTEKLDPESQRFLNIIKYDQAETEQSIHKDRLKEIDERIGEICVEFDANLHNEDGGFWADEAELVGVPMGILDELEKGTSDNEGKFRVIYKWAIGLPVLEHAMDPDIRKKLYLGRAHSVSSFNSLYSSFFAILLPSNSLDPSNID
jgi:metallopeptidase MepB